MMKRKVRFILLILPVPAAFILLGLYLSFVRVPRWYKPIAVGVDQQQSLRDDLTELTRIFNNSMQTADAFDFVLSEDQVNRLIAGRDLIDPKLSELIPKNVIAPAVAFADGEIRAAAMVEYKGIRAINSLALTLSVGREYITINKITVRVGLWPVPSDIIAKALAKHTSVSGKNMRFENYFSYPNSDYDLTIKSIVVRNGQIHLRIQPILR